MKSNRSNLKILKYFLLFFTILLVLFGLSSFTISNKYNISPLASGKSILRHAALSSIYYILKIYDPCPIKKAELFPEDYQKNINWEKFTRVENLKDELKNEKIVLNDIKNEKIINSGFEFSYQPYDEQNLTELRKTYKLDDVVASAQNEFDEIVLLRNWARSQFRRNDFQPRMEPFDAVKILKRDFHNKDNKPYTPDKFRPCHFFPLFYSQVMLSMGFQTRLCRISTGPSETEGHGLTEVWSNQYKKWITMDPDVNSHFEKDGIPQNLLEVHNEQYAKRSGELIIKRGMQTSGDGAYKNEIDVNGMINYHRYFQIVDMRNDWMTNDYFRGHPQKSDMARLLWVDKNMAPVFSFSPKTDSTDDFYWTLNQTEILANKKVVSSRNLQLGFKTFTPNFDYFEINPDSEKKKKLYDSVWSWTLHKGKNRLSICSVNKFGRKGIKSQIEIFVD